MHISTSTSCTDFTVNSKIFGEPRVLPPVLFMIEELNKAFLCRLFSVSCKQDVSDYEQNTPEYTYQRNVTVFSLRIGLSFSIASGRDSKQTRIYLQRNYRIFTPQSRCSLHAILTQMIRFWIPPMMLSDRSAHTWIRSTCSFWMVVDDKL